MSKLLALDLSLGFYGSSACLSLSITTRSCLFHSPTLVDSSKALPKLVYQHFFPEVAARGRMLGEYREPTCARACYSSVSGNSWGVGSITHQDSSWPASRTWSNNWTSPMLAAISSASSCSDQNLEKTFRRTATSLRCRLWDSVFANNFGRDFGSQWTLAEVAFIVRPRIKSTEYSSRSWS